MQQNSILTSYLDKKNIKEYYWVAKWRFYTSL